MQFHRTWARSDLFSLLFTLILGATLLGSPAMPVRADDLGDVQQLLKGGNAADALKRADQFLAGNPKDAQMRFLKGVALAEQNRANDAVTVFVKITEDFPELPEPYNNLAVLYANQGHYDKARTALEMAIRTNPGYATAHENLGDVYARLAAQSYGRAQQQDPSNATVGPKLALIRQLPPHSAEGEYDPIEAIERVIERTKEREIADLKRGLGGLASISSAAPFIGLFGTVVGIINAFKGISTEKSTGLGAVAGGISEALVATAIGLFVAIPAVWMFNYFTTKLESFDVEMGNSASELLDYFLKKTQQKAGAAK